MGKSVRNTEFAVKIALFVSLCVLIHFIVTSSIIQYEGDKTAYFKIQDFHYYIVMISVFLFSFRTVTVIFLGQTSLLASALLLLLLLEMALASKEGRSLRRWIIYPVIFVLSMKMHYLVLGMGILLIGGYIYELLASSVIVGFSIGFLILYTGLALITGFMEQISLFSAHELPAYYDFTDVFHTFFTFRSAFAPIIGGSLSLKISLIVLLFGCMSIFCISVFQSGGMGKNKKNFQKVTTLQMIIAFFALLLLFLPYIGGDEDVLLCIPFAAVCLSPVHMQRKYGKIFVIIPFLFIVLNQSIMLSSDHLWLYWGMKAFILIYLFFFQKGALSPRAGIVGQLS